MNHPQLLIVHPDPSVSAMLASMLRSLRYEIDEVGDDRAAVRRLGPSVALLVAALDPENPDSLELLVYARRKHPEVPVILLSPDLALAGEASRRGAAAVLRCPPMASELRAVVIRALERPIPAQAAAGSDVRPLDPEPPPGHAPIAGRNPLVGSSPSAPDSSPCPGRAGDGNRQGREGDCRLDRRGTAEAEEREPAPSEVSPPGLRSMGGISRDPSKLRLRPLKKALEEPERRILLQALEGLWKLRQPGLMVPIGEPSG